MKSVPWRRIDLIERVKADIWRYLTPAADIETELLEASALLQMRPSELRTLGSLQFLISDELGRLLAYLPFLLRRLATTTAHEEEISADRIRGAIQWSRTFGLRYATGIPHVYVTAPSRRAYQTPENELLVFLLDEAIMLGKLLGWEGSTSERVGVLVGERVGSAQRWSQARALSEVERRRIEARAIARIRAGRLRHRYQPVLDAWERYSALVGRLDRSSIRRAVETYGVVSRDDATLLELYCTFETLSSLSELGWRFGRLRLFGGALRLIGVRDGERCEVTYQATPKVLRTGSLYRHLQVAHRIPAGGLRPDLVLRHTADGQERWLMIEVKGGQRSVEDSARAALYDLLAYRTAFKETLDHAPTPYGLGIAWGAELEPSLHGEIMLCSPDTLRRAFRLYFEDRSSSAKAIEAN